MAAARIGLARRAAAPVLRLRVMAILAILVAWEALGRSGLVYAGALPSWGTILAALARLLLSWSFWLALAVTGLEIALGASARLGVGLQRYLHYLASTPKVVFLPLFLLLFGIGPGAKVAIGAFACSLPLALGTAAAMRHVPPVLVRVGRGFGLSRWQMARLIYLPALLAPLVSGLRIALGVAVAACLVAEMRVSTRGLGALIIGSYDHARFAEVYALLAVVVGLAIAASASFDRLHRRLNRRGTA